MIERAPAWRRPPPARPFVLGHRGARHAAPENTLAAFTLALNEGADGVELDVRLDRDGRVVVVHDPTLERVSDGRSRRAIEDLGASELDNVDVGAGQRVPSLDDVLVWSRRQGSRLNVELKQDVADRSRLVRAVSELLVHETAERIILSTFHPGMARALVGRLPHLPVAWLVHDRQWLLRHTPGRRCLGVHAVHPQASLVTEAAVRSWHASGHAVNVWTVNDPDDARRLAAAGVDGIISDCPGRILEAIGRPGLHSEQTE
jgi:glycerophosphoryl diester phosphodiesterase